MTVRTIGWLRWIIAIAVCVACFAWALPALASYQDVFDTLGPRLSEMSGAAIAILLFVVVANLIAPSMSQVAALPGLSLRRAVWVDWASTAVTNVLPAGSAIAIGLTWSMYRSFGLAKQAIARSIVVTGVWDALVKLGTPLLALTWLSTQRPASATFIQAAVVGSVLFVVALALFAVILFGPGAARTLGRLIDALPILSDGWPQRLNELRVNTLSLLSERGASLTWWTIAGHANLYVLLALCLRAVGVEQSVLGWAPILAAFAFGRLVTAIPITPGGLGVMEVGLTGALGAVGNAPTPQIVAAVLLFRFVTFALPLAFGLGGLAWWNAKRPAGSGLLGGQPQQNV